MRIALVACGRQKLAHPAPAHELYTGTSFRMRRDFALSCFPRDQVLVLSSRYGLVGLDEVIEPYNQYLGDPGAVTLSQLRRQVEARGLRKLSAVHVFSGATIYIDTVRLLWPRALVIDRLRGLPPIKRIAYAAEKSREYRHRVPHQ